MSGTALSTRPVLLFYLTMGVAALAIGTWRGHVHRWLEPSTALLDAGIGITLGLVVVVISRLGMRIRSLRVLSEEFGRILRGLSGGQVVLFALLSGIGEEMLFRGVLQPELGWLWATLLFAVIHVGPAARFLWWTVFALIVGGMLGFLFSWRESLVAPVFAHTVINLLNLHFLSRLEPQTSEA